VNIQNVAKKIKVPVEQWVGNCDLIALAMIRYGVVNGRRGKRVRGLWVGPINPESYFGYRADIPLVPHSWIQMTDTRMPVRFQDESGNLVFRMMDDPIVDPTRFAFEGKPPYIYIGPSDHYDARGDGLRAVMEQRYSPLDRAEKSSIPLSLPGKTEYWIGMQVQFTYPYGWYPYSLCFWLANLSLDRLGEHARPIYEALVKAGHEALIPLDNREEILGE
jgi:hypothetical protein